jgi:hypothetical protein
MGRNRRGGIPHRTLVSNSWALVVESKRLLICQLERRLQVHHGHGDARLLGRLHEELELAENNCRASRGWGDDAVHSAQLKSMYTALIRTANACAAQLSSDAAKLAPPDQFNAAVTVQTIEELMQHWRDAAGS